MREPIFKHVDLSHTIHDGMITYKGLPAPVICDFLSRTESMKLYSPGTSFQIGRINMVANTGTYVDAPFHRFEDGKDLSELELESLADVNAALVRAPDGTRAIDREAFLSHNVRGKGCSQHWRREQYFEGHPHLARAAAEYLRDEGATLVGIDSYNIDDTENQARPVHTRLHRTNNIRWIKCADNHHRRESKSFTDRDGRRYLYVRTDDAELFSCHV